MVPRPLALDLARMNPRSSEYLKRLSEYAKSHSDRVEGLFLSPVHKGAVDHVTKVIGDIAARYAVDGIHLDYIRFPNDEFDYSAETLDEFRSRDRFETLCNAERREYSARARGRPLFYTEMFPQRWQEFRRARLTALLTKIRTTVKSRRPAAMLTAAVFPDATEATDTTLSGMGPLARGGAPRCDLPDGLYDGCRPCFERRSPTSSNLPGNAPCGPALARINSPLPRRSRTSGRQGSLAPRASSCFRTTI